MADEEDPKVDPELDLDEPEVEPEPEPEPDEPEPEVEPEPLAASPEPGTEPAAEPQRPSRRDTRIASLTERLKEADAERETFRRRLAEVEQRYSQPKPVQESPEARAQRRALMTPQEVMQEELQEAKNSFTQQLQQVQWQNAETADKTTFQAKCASHPLYAKYAPKVEGKLAELRAKGIWNAEREVLLKVLIGEAALERYSSKEGKKEVADARQRVRRQTVRPSNSGSDEAATRRREESLERRLENLNI